jgi:competence ComEA-like helix-hairpin-helix protein
LKEKLSKSIPKNLGITTTEFYVVLVIVLGFIVGVIGTNYFPIEDKNQNNISADSLKHILDSIADIEKTRFIGTDTNNIPVDELAAADTFLYKKPPKKSEFKGVVNINTASKSELMQLYRIGDKMSDRIIEYRKNKKFKRKEDILNVKGIGIKTFEKIKNNITI